eukprot:TRINITY_DN1761_c0_g1_i1.p1 TRINITY_DN1761_c0_g1~~TRINITY_DN1761_c0_g1_i1.p1  ORF type:complete len:208 (-),score=35.70 TRINITY_DN1761_c0_g1_i1:17-640(-)
MTNLFGKQKTLKKKKVRVNQQVDFDQVSQSQLQSDGEIIVDMECPKHADLNEWLAFNTIEFYNQVHLLYGCVSEFCTNQSCPTMSAGTSFHYVWKQTRFKKKTLLTAPQYVDQFVNWVQEYIDDEEFFPSDGDYKKNFRQVIEQIFKRLFHIYAHIYHSHLNEIQDLGVDAHLNTSFKHFISLSKLYILIPENEYDPLLPLILTFNI